MDAHWLTFAVDCETGVVGLDSQITGKVDGALSADQLEWLMTAEATPPAYLIFLHHPPTSASPGWTVCDCETRFHFSSCCRNMPM